MQSHYQFVWARIPCLLLPTGGVNKSSLQVKVIVWLECWLLRVFGFEVTWGGLRAQFESSQGPSAPITGELDGIVVQPRAFRRSDALRANWSSSSGEKVGVREISSRETMRVPLVRRSTFNYKKKISMHVNFFIYVCYSFSMHIIIYFYVLQWKK